MNTRFLLFAVVGGAGFVIDAGLTLALITAGVPPLLARPPAILAAMVFTWLANRTLTFRVSRERTMEEALRYSAVAVFVALVNYLIYSVLALHGLAPFIAIAIATALAMFLSYFGYKHFAFRMPADSR